ncbi:RNA-binding S4 domain-containing protein [Methylobacterium haplocladii]|uniref:RNA-binding protein S4 n=1 Tax=Methylobacterium haplocladii TaxID=1176176 RepID=A0A512IPS4_9HYPH|nr:RNA-binding S4 domain-containing protein [Methylobacterium haplocladii]GEO99697.1 RNA-binding protein S4 [Methylobacterium haplocladii]GJD84672.1 Heat shock protein 15 [Methylobacterium haplocladii]GLS61197.1 RNA-binding protein S4 [Methylobacterium haplocladii]
MSVDRQRLDKWLWFARFAKTRSLAARLVADGHVRINGRRAEAPAKGVAVGDVLTVAATHVTALVRVVDLGQRRGPAPEARGLYADLGGTDLPTDDRDTS